MRFLLIGALLIVSAFACIPQAAAQPGRPERLIFDPSDPSAPQGIFATDAEIEKSPRGLQIRTHTNESWPGIRIVFDPAWDLAAYAEIRVRLKNAGEAEATVHCRVDNPGADGNNHCRTGSSILQPGQTGEIRVGLKRANDDKLGGKLFGMRGYPVASGGPDTVDPANITQVLIFVSKPTSEHVLLVESVRAAGGYTAPTASVTDADPFFPFIDTFGQYRHKAWPGKVTSVEDLQRRAAAEAQELKARPGPAGWDQYGGAKLGPQLEATGFFRTQKVASKWWLVDPEGHLFFSHGVDCVRAFDSTPIEEREEWLADFPGKQPAFAQFLSRDFALKGHYAGRSPQCFSFVGANLLRKYGEGWEMTYRNRVHQRLRSWGLNTIGNWSDAATFQLRRTPYTDAISSGGSRPIEGSEGYWGKFPDVFDAGFAEHLSRSMEQKRGKSAGDPWCIGYFSDNEMSWGDELSLGLAVLQSPANQPAKKALVEDLKGNYPEIHKLNQAWGSQYASWEELLANRSAPDRRKAEPDLKRFYTLTAERYFRLVRETIKSVAPHQLYLGCRFAWVNPKAAAAAAKYCDVVSYNLYRESVEFFQFNGGADVPLMIGEFHFGALDRGMFHTGLVSLPNQQARAETYRNYVLGALRHPQFVGCHWFQYFDEPTTGRTYDEENYQIGLVDIADTPYRETVQACREVGDQLYSTLRR